MTPPRETDISYPDEEIDVPVPSLKQVASPPSRLTPDTMILDYCPLHRPRPTTQIQEIGFIANV